MSLRQNMQSGLDGFYSKSQFIVQGDQGGSVKLSIKAPPFENIVFEGGGVCGYVYMAAISEMNETHELDRCKRVAGSSAGAITALAVALGMDSNQILSIISDVDFNKMVEIPLENMAQMVGGVAKRGYINEGERLLAFIRGIIRDRVQYLLEKYPEKLAGLAINPDRVTFKNLQDIASRIDKAGIKDFFVTATELSTDSKNEPPRLVVFSADNPQYENVEIALAVRASASIPVFFKQVEIPGLEGKKFIDGGCMSNFPMNIFESQRYAPKNIFLYRGDEGQNLCTFGFKVDTVKEMRELLFEKNEDSRGSRLKATIEGFLSEKIIKVDIMKTDRENAEMVRRNYAHRVCQIENCGISMTKFNLTPEDKNGLFLSGSEATKGWLENYFRAPIVHGKSYKSFEALCESLPIRYLDALRKDIETGKGQRGEAFFQRGQEVFFDADKEPLSDNQCQEMLHQLESILVRRKQEEALLAEMELAGSRSQRFFALTEHPLLDLFMLKIQPCLKKPEGERIKEVIGVLAELLKAHEKDFKKEIKYWNEKVIGELVKPHQIDMKILMPVVMKYTGMLIQQQSQLPLKNK